MFFNSRFLIPFVSIIIPVRAYLMCHQCLSENNPNCLQNADFLAPCPEDTKQCYIYNINQRLYKRGCLHPTDKNYINCAIKRDNACFTCHGWGCNYVDVHLQTQSLQYCLHCNSDKECQEKKEAERCDTQDTIFGPPRCITQYSEKGDQITKNGCYSMFFGLGKDQRTFPCNGQTCNYIKTDFVHRCVFYAGNRWKFQKDKRVEECFEGVYHGLVPGCFIQESGPPEMFFYGCLSRKQPSWIRNCKKGKHCQVCHGDMCNNLPVKYKNICRDSKLNDEVCESIDSMCYTFKEPSGQLHMGCVTDLVTPGLYNADTLMCSNRKLNTSACAPIEDYDSHRGCYECSGPLCDDVLVNLGYTARTVCPRGVTQCYSSQRLDGMTFRGCYANDSSEGVRVCKDSLGACKICSHNNCNFQNLVALHGQCYKSNWAKRDRHEASLRFADCTGRTFHGNKDICYVAFSSRLFMRMGCLSELVSGVDHTYEIITGSTQVAWVFQNSCYKCKSNAEGFCFDVTFLKESECLGLHRYPVRGCYTLIDRRAQRMERGCITELNEYMLRLCEMSVFDETCQICQDSGCNNDKFRGFEVVVNKWG